MRLLRSRTTSKDLFSDICDELKRWHNQSPEESFYIYDSNSTESDSDEKERD